MRGPRIDGGRKVKMKVGNARKRIAVLGVLLVAAGGWIGLASQQGDHSQSTEMQAMDPGVSFLSDPNLPSPMNTGLKDGELFLKMMLSVVLVIGLGAAALYLSKRVLPKVTNAAGKEVRIVETTYLGPRKALHLVEVGGQRLLIASTNESITTLAHVGDAWLDMSRQDVADTVKL